MAGLSGGDCLVCGAWLRQDPETGYIESICQFCADQGWTTTNHGELIQEAPIAVAAPPDAATREFIPSAPNGGDSGILTDEEIPI